MIRLFLAILVFAVCSPAAGQSYPNRPVRILVGFTPGGGTDIMARLLAPKLSEYLGQQFVVENRPGAATNIATEMAARAAPDGYTLLFTTASMAINASLYKNLPFDVQRDLVAVSALSQSPNVLVVHQSTARDIGELVKTARTRPGALNYSSAGAGTTQHLAAELFKMRTGTFIVHIPYRGTAPSMTALIAGEVQLSFANIPAIIGHVKSGRLRPLAIAAAKRSELMPDVPTLKEAGIDVEVPVWYGLLAPSATPRDIVGILAEASMRAANSPDLRQRLVEQGAEPVGSTPEEFGRTLREDIAKWAEVVKASGARPE
jgi:tripartite-type tricarboxylate transporter receptor subunit TctC